MHLKKALLTTFLVVGGAAANAQILTTFGSTAEDGGPTWDYDPQTSTISGTEGFGDLIYGAPATPILLTGNTMISLTGSATIVPAGTFTVVLEDSAAELAFATFLWSDFASGPRTVAVALSYSASNFEEVVGWSLVSGGSLQQVEASFSEMSAVPEPSVFALIGLAGLVAARRRKAVRVS
jgi:hypothetical protein